MKVQNPTKLDIFFKGGGIIKFPVQNLKQIDIEPIDEQGGGGSSDQPTKLDALKNYVNLLYDNYNVEFDVVEETSTYDEDVYNEEDEPTGEVVTATLKTYKFVPKTDVPKVYLTANEGDGYVEVEDDTIVLHADARPGSGSFISVVSKIVLNGTELTIQQVINNYDIVQVGTAKLPINIPTDFWVDYAGYLEYLDWIRNNATEFAEVPILLYGEQLIGGARTYTNFGFTKSSLDLNGNNGYYSQTVYDVIRQGGEEDPEEPTEE